MKTILGYSIEDLDGEYDVHEVTIDEFDSQEFNYVKAGCKADVIRYLLSKGVTDHMFIGIQSWHEAVRRIP